ncbi:dihydrofolate reductase family protein [Actinomadura viridis]|uniref:Dihydrofolate reductase n=1 Tax=Actinomadura viridis TaxID=58110 RepID=A0A931GK12_9ACTN|nr:dihydrofolate reductase family protein [Actinomadura viridis]MBG6090333.1 dihydrofolate reductase [Actinomadura viridis]
MKLTVTTFVTLDGVMQGPGGPTEDTDGGFGLGGWLVPYFDEETGAFITDIFDRVGAFLLGRRTYEIFASHWPHVTDPSDPVASKLNSLPKYVASRTLDTVDWAGAALIEGDVPDAVRRLKDAPGEGELQVHGSAGLIQTLLAEDLVDEFNLLVFPVVLGTGKRLFGAGTAPAALSLSSARATGSGVVLHTYRRAGELKQGTIE